MNNRISRSLLNTLLIACVVMVVTACPARADAGVPMLVVIWPISWLLLIPVVFLEAFLCRKMLKLQFKQALTLSAEANAVSTIVGIPLTWLATLAVQMATGGGSGWGISTPFAKVAAVTLHGSWLIPYEDDLYWMIPWSAVFLCSVFFLTSVWVERKVVAHMLPSANGAAVSRWAWIANSLSYALLAAAVVVLSILQPF